MMADNGTGPDVSNAYPSVLAPQESPLTTNQSPLTAPQEPRTFRRFVYQSLGLAAIMVASLSGYLLVLKIRGPAAQVETYLPWDEIVAFQPGWVWVYLVPYLVGPVVIGLMRRSTFNWYVTRGLTIVGLTLAVFLVFPSKTRDRDEEVIRSLRACEHDWTAQLYVRMIEIDDPPANAAPSLHISLTCLLAMALLKDFPRWWPATFMGVGLVWVATLGTRQHHLIDVMTGALVTFLVVFAWPRKERAG